MEILVNDEKIILNKDNLKFSEQTLNNYFMQESGYYSYFSEKLCLAENELQKSEMNYENAYSEKFTTLKEKTNSSDKLCENKAKIDETVKSLKEKVLEKKLNVRLLQQYLKTFDKNHDNALNLGYSLRKEMEKLNFDIKASKNLDDSLVDKVFKHD